MIAQGRSSHGRGRAGSWDAIVVASEVELAVHLATAATIGRRLGAEEVEAHVPVAEPLERVLAAQHGGEQGQIARRGGVEGPKCPVVTYDSPVRSPISRRESEPVVQSSLALACMREQDESLGAGGGAQRIVPADELGWRFRLHSQRNGSGELQRVPGAERVPGK